MINNPRIISGKFKGKKLQVPKTARPVTDRVKKTIFDILGEEIKNKVVLDLFAGSGSFGIESLSRGAKFVFFADKSEKAIKSILENLTKIKVENNKYKLIISGYKTIFLKIKQPIDIIFLDPPFDLVDKMSFEFLKNEVTKYSLIIFRFPEKKPLEKSFSDYSILLKKIIGINKILFLRRLENIRSWN